MIETRGSWTLEKMLICPDCNLTDYIDRAEQRRFGRPIKVDPTKHRVPRKDAPVATPPKMVCQNPGCGLPIYKSVAGYRHTNGKRECGRKRSKKR